MFETEAAYLPLPGVLHDDHDCLFCSTCIELFKVIGTFFEDYEDQPILIINDV